MARRYAALAVDPCDTDSNWADLTGAQQSLYVTVLRDGTLTQAGEVGLTLRAWSLQAADRTPETVEADLRALADHGYLVIDWDRERVLVTGYIASDGSLGNPKHAGGCISSLSKVKSPVLRAALVRDMALVPDDGVAAAKLGQFRALQDQMTPHADGPSVGNAIGNPMPTPQPVNGNREPETGYHETPPGGAAEPAPPLEDVDVDADPFGDPIASVVDAVIEPDDAPAPATSKSAEDQEREPVTTDQLVALYVRLYQDKHSGKRPPGDLCPRMGNVIKPMLADGTDPADIAAGLRLMILKPKCGPATLSGFVAEATVDPELTETKTAGKATRATAAAECADAETRAEERLLGRDRTALTVVRDAPKEIAAS